ncbi:MAG TPA: hypothetical protein VJV78_21460 [Polyangiales bacterium]|nr:hypothetical protein [Polyangiales bacterium]
MASDGAPLLSKEQVQAIAERLRPLRQSDPKDLLREAEARVVSQRRATDLLEYPVPFFFEFSSLERGKESTKGKTLHGYDEHNRLALIESEQDKPINVTVFDYTGNGATYASIDKFPDRLDMSFVGERGKFEGTNYDISLDTLGRIVAYMWPDPAAAPRIIQYWNLARQQLSIMHIEVDERGAAARIERNGNLIFPKPRPAPGPVNLDKCAKQLLALVRKRVPKKHEPIVLLTAAIQSDDLESIPPSFGVVFQRDAEAFARDPGAYNDDLDKLLSPTLQEDSDFPTRTKYPFVDISKEDAPAFDSWSDEQILELAPQLVDRMNAQRKPTDPPFLLVDMEDDATKYLSRLSEDDRKKLEPYGIVSPPSS